MFSGEEGDMACAWVDVGAERDDSAERVAECGSRGTENSLSTFGKVGVVLA